MSRDLEGNGIEEVVVEWVEWEIVIWERGTAGCADNMMGVGGRPAGGEGGGGG